MKKNSLFLLFLSSLLAYLPLLSHAQTPNHAQSVYDLIKTKTKSVSFSQLGVSNTLTLRGNGSNVGISFGVRDDEIISKAKLKISYVYSPSFLERLSHIKLYLNEEVIGILPMPNEDAGHKIIKEITFDPQLISDYNQIRMQMIGHYITDQCEDPQHTSIWADISAKSEIIFNVEPLPISNNLENFPKPFFDEHISTPVTVPFVFASNPNLEKVEAAGILSSWFGAKADWRGVKFPVLIDQRPEQHAVVLATNEHRPAFLKEYPDVTEPTIAIISLPLEKPPGLKEDEPYPTENPYIKLLLILAPNDEGLKQATQALTLGKAVLAGQSATVKSVDLGPLRKPYDAPNWVRLDRPTKLGELVNSLTELQVSGHTPQDIRVNMRIPADLFTWRSNGIPVDLKYRYTPLVSEDESRLNVNINQQFVEAFNLKPSGKGGIKQRVRVPLLDEGLFGTGNEFYIPAFKLGSHNQMSFSFSFAYQTQGLCQASPTDNVQASIDADSTIDFTGFPHYAALPNLGFFANSGYPFSVQADLANTVIAMPDHSNSHLVESALTVLGRIGVSTGYPVTRLEILPPDKMDDQVEKNIIIIGSNAHQKLLKKWDLELPISVSSLGVKQSAPTNTVNLLNDWLGFETAPNPEETSDIFVKSKGVLGAILGFESPIHNGSSVISLIGAQDQDLQRVISALGNSSEIAQMHGSAVLLRTDTIESVLVGDTYRVGNLPWYTEVWYFLSQHPVLLAIVMFVAIIFVTFLLWRALTIIMKQRIKGAHD